MLKISLILSILLILAGCAAEPEKIKLDFDACAHCAMKISDPRFAAELVTEKGKVFKFDDISCLDGFISENKPDGESKLYVASYEGDGSWYSLTEAVLVHSGNLRSPMGGNTAGFEKRKDAEDFVNKSGGTIISWSEFRNIAEE